MTHLSYFRSFAPVLLSDWLFCLHPQCMRRTKDLLGTAAHLPLLLGQCSAATPKTTPAGQDPAHCPALANGAPFPGYASYQAHRPAAKPRPQRGSKHMALHV